MARVKRAVHGRKHHRAVLEQAQGYYGNKSRCYQAANEQVMHSLQYAFRDRRARKGDFRQLWIQRINAGCRQHGHELQPLHHRPAGGRDRGRPQGPGRPGRHRRGRLRRLVKVAGGAAGADAAASRPAPTRRRAPSARPAPPRASASGAGSSACARARASGTRARGGAGLRGRGPEGRRRRPRRRRAPSRRCIVAAERRRRPRSSTGPWPPASGRPSWRPGVLERVADTVTPQPVLAVARLRRRRPRRPAATPTWSWCASTSATPATPARCCAAPRRRGWAG